jgi:hypothetical protein
MTPTVYPLSWPQSFARAKYREHGKFKTALPNAIKNVQSSLKLFAQDSGKKLESLVISSNVSLDNDSPADPGVAVWFVWDGLQVCIPVDRYHSVASNLHAIHHILEARRVELRHGTLSLVRATFQGFLALPSPTARSWRDVLSLPQGTVSAQDLEQAFRRAASKAHPDKGGTDSAMAEVNVAYDQARRELGL